MESKIFYADGLQELQGEDRVNQVKEWRKKYEEENNWILKLKNPYDDDEEEEEGGDDELTLDSASSNYFEQSYPLTAQIAKGIRTMLNYYKQNTTEEEREEFCDESALISVNTYYCSISIDIGDFTLEYYCDEKMMDCLTMLEYLEEKDRLVVSQELDHWLDDTMPGSDSLEEMGLGGMYLEYSC